MAYKYLLAPVVNRQNSLFASIDAVYKSIEYISLALFQYSIQLAYLNCLFHFCPLQKDKPVTCRLLSLLLVTLRTRKSKLIDKCIPEERGQTQIAPYEGRKTTKNISALSHCPFICLPLEKSAPHVLEPLELDIRMSNNSLSPFLSIILSCQCKRLFSIENRCEKECQSDCL